MKKIAIAMSIMILLAMVPVSALAAGYDSKQNHVSYWCVDGGEKWESGHGISGSSVTTTRDWAMIVLKSALDNNVWEPAKAGTYTTRSGKDISHVIVCYGDYRVKSDPRARILGPCGDPMYAAVFDNRRGIMTHAFVMWVNGKKVAKRFVGAGEKIKTGYKYVRPFSRITIKLMNGRVLKSERAAAGGWYGWGSRECKR